MKKVIISGLVAGLLSVTPIFADEINNTVNPGITPDSPLYTVDQLVEDIQLSLTSNIERKAEILLAITQERLAEAKQMTEEDKVEFVKKAMEAYGEKIEEAFETVSEAILKESIDSAAKEALSIQLEDSTEVIESVEAVITDEQKEKLGEKRDSAYLVANVVRDLDMEKVKILREEQKLGYGQIAKVFSLADASGKSVEEIADMITVEGKGFGEIAKELGIHPSEMKMKANKKKQVSQIKEAKTDLEDVPVALEEAKETEADEAEKAADERTNEIEKITKQVEKKIEKINKAQEKKQKEVEKQQQKEQKEKKDSKKDKKDE
ncbi:vacuolar-type H+-ATPase subunit I/STV1 [Anaerosolibacter carboniphilus]|uniref:Vacuolar-type H+-ATPase subunit I/STV1 n=1 Tax=Anaerosolibacter carboniphilus TaxID=1417629 RepID=A0A841L4W8_9FIRM|nr:DUF5667 domain-containing protein [Anaerosolibacter carboniphilus]MBB6217365.1 vacuolar-type H+-ATPase subunit I/STV1 [Anaerosolibacter carboniphilus]